MAPAGHSYFTLWRVQMFTGATILWVLITKSKRLFWAVWSKLKMASRKSHSCRAGVEAKSSVSWPKASPTSCLAWHFMCTQIAPAFTFHLEGFKFKPWFLCQNVSQLAIQRDHSSRNLFTHRERNLVCWRRRACCHSGEHRHNEDFIPCSKAFPALSTLTWVISETTEVCP